MKVGEYIRTKYGITQFKEYDTIDGSKLLCMPVKDGSQGIFANVEDVIKSSPNIIDLIEVGDYVNGYLVKDIDYAFDDVVMNNKNARIVPYIDCNKDKYIDDIKSVVTHEQFSQMEYRIGE